MHFYLCSEIPHGPSKLVSTPAAVTSSVSVLILVDFLAQLYVMKCTFFFNRLSWWPLIWLTLCYTAITDRLFIPPAEVMVPPDMEYRSPFPLPRFAGSQLFVLSVTYACSLHKIKFIVYWAFKLSLIL
jgi:hypothetical protein